MEATMNKILSNKKAIVFFILPELLIFLFVVIYSVGCSFYYSLHSWNGITAVSYTHLDVYKRQGYKGNSRGDKIRILGGDL